MSLFHSILARLEAQVIKEASGTEEVATIVSSVLGTTVSPEQIKIKQSVLTLNVPATLKLALKLKQTKLVEALEKYKISKVQ